MSVDERCGEFRLGVEMKDTCNETGFSTFGDLTMATDEPCMFNLLAIQLLYGSVLIYALVLLIWCYKLVRLQRGLKKRSRLNTWTIRMAAMLAFVLISLSVLRCAFPGKVEMMVGGGVLPGLLYALWFLCLWSMIGAFIAKFVFYFLEMTSASNPMANGNQSEGERLRVKFFKMQLIGYLLACSVMLVPGCAFAFCNIQTGCSPDTIQFWTLAVNRTVPITIILAVFFVGHTSVKFVVSDLHTLEEMYINFGQQDEANATKTQRENLWKMLLFLKIVGFQCAVTVFVTTFFPWINNRLGYGGPLIAWSTEHAMAGILWVIWRQTVSELTKKKGKASVLSASGKKTHTAQSTQAIVFSSLTGHGNMSSVHPA